MNERLAEAIFTEKLWAALVVALLLRLGFALEGAADHLEQRVGAASLLAGKLPPPVAPATLLATHAGYTAGEAGWDRVSIYLMGRAFGPSMDAPDNIVRLEDRRPSPDRRARE